jgi:predicted XRE-type DNA-binding protein
MRRLNVPVADRDLFGELHGRSELQTSCDRAVCLDCETSLKAGRRAEILMVSRPRVSDVVNKKTASFTIDTLVEMLCRVGKPVKLACKALYCNHHVEGGEAVGNHSFRGAQALAPQVGLERQHFTAAKDVLFPYFAALPAAFRISTRGRSPIMKILCIFSFNNIAEISACQPRLACYARSRR